MSTSKTQKHYPIGDARLARLEAVCKARCGAAALGSAEKLFATMKENFREMPETIQEQLLSTMEESVGILKENGLIPQAPVDDKLVDSLMQSITAGGAETPAVAASETATTTQP